MDSNGQGKEEEERKEEEEKDQWSLLKLDSNEAQGKEEEGRKEEEEEDQWSLPKMENNETPWHELTKGKRVLRVGWYILRLLLLLGFLYLFFCMISILGSAFRLLGGKVAGMAMSNTVLLQNPVAGVMLGVLVTVLVQSSSTSTSIVVSMVSADMLSVRTAIPIIMGANVGTAITNTLVAIAQSGRGQTFRRAFAAATLHDMFNWLSVVVFLPLEVATHYLFHLTRAVTKGITLPKNASASDNPQLLKALTNPLTERIIVLSSSKIHDIALGQGINGSLIKEGDHLFSYFSLSDAAAGGILLSVSVVVLILCLLAMVKTLSSLLKGSVARLFQKFVNSDLPGPVGKHLTGYLAILIGMGLTMVVQSSSIVTSTLTPLVGMGAMHIDRMYPLTLGSSIGGTVTGILAALASDPVGFKNSLQVALAHLFFNISGIVVWYPVPLMRRVPLRMAKFLGHTVCRYRWFAALYLLVVYGLFPLAVFGLSLLGWKVLLGVALPIVVLTAVVVVINVIQNKRPDLLPERLRSWEALGVPEPLRSLEPYHKLFTACLCRCSCCRKDISSGGEQLMEKEEEEEEEVGEGEGSGRDDLDEKKKLEKAQR